MSRSAPSRDHTIDARDCADRQTLEQHTAVRGPDLDEMAQAGLADELDRERRRVQELRDEVEELRRARVVADVRLRELDALEAEAEVLKAERAAMARDAADREADARLQALGLALGNLHQAFHVHTVIHPRHEQALGEIPRQQVQPFVQSATTAGQNHDGVGMGFGVGHGHWNGISETEQPDTPDRQHDHRHDQNPARPYGGFTAWTLAHQVIRFRLRITVARAVIMARKATATGNSTKPTTWKNPKSGFGIMVAPVSDAR